MAYRTTAPKARTSQLPQTFASDRQIGRRVRVLFFAAPAFVFSVWYLRSLVDELRKPTTELLAAFLAVSVGLLVSALLLYLIVLQLSWTRRVMGVNHGGVHLRSPKDSWSLSWGEIEKATLIRDDVGAHRVVFRPASGDPAERAFVFANLREDEAHRLMDLLVVELADQRRIRLVNELRTDQELPLGEGHASRSGIRLGEIRLPWDALQRIEDDGDSLTLRFDGMRVFVANRSSMREAREVLDALREIGVLKATEALSPIEQGVRVALDNHRVSSSDVASEDKLDVVEDEAVEPRLSLER